VVFCSVPLSQLLKNPSIEGRPVLNPQISDRSFKWAYREMAALALELSKHGIDAIGALARMRGVFELPGDLSPSTRMDYGVCKFA
jgi:hypothetical protein